MKLFLLAVAIFGIINARSLKQRGLSKDDEWFEPLKALATEVIVETFDIEGVKDKVEETVDDCMQQDDVTDCLEGEVDAVSDALGKDVSKEARDDARVKVAALADFLKAVYETCKDVEGDEEIGKCAFEEGKRFCAASDFDKKDCMHGVMFVLKKAGEIANRKEDKRGVSKDDDWFEPLRDLGTEVIVETFDLEGVKDKVKQTVEDCMQKDDVTACLEGEVDAVSDALGKDVPQEARDDAKVKVAALSDFLGAVYKTCKDVPEEELGKCAFEEGKRFCEASDFDKKECMGGVMFVLGKAKKMADGKKKSDKRGLSKDDEWFEPLKTLATEVIVETFDIEGVKDKVEETVDDCMQQDDVTDCLEGEVDAVSDALGKDVPKEARDDARVKVAALADFLKAVYETCKDVEGDEEIGKCAFEEGKRFCAASDFDKKDCMRGVMFVLKKAGEIAGRKED
ncbi:unnamed protein product [Mytilus coruscus]|uniref:Uncharacterized protein n=1 Tax=Mytilus coruscus TaxID=42192 RepID=A0A6J8BNH7_MYTCO|nr:unnamed protein product [Mytilus coruscus]